VIGVIAAAVCGRLGLWQLDRLAERRNANALVERRLSQATVDPLRSELHADSLRFRRVTLTGVFDFDHQVVVVARSYQGVPGVYIVTPLLMENGRAVLVERGWAPSPDGRTVDLAQFTEDDSVSVEGVLRETEPDTRLGEESGWPMYARSANPAQLQIRFDYTLLPLVVRRTSLPALAPAGLRPVSMRPLTDGPHLSYAVQWFTFGAIALVGGAILSFKQSRSLVREGGVGSRE